jgi:hypothetical protein
MTKPDDKLTCLSCGRELAPGDVREAFVRSSLIPEGEVYGPLCAACAEPLIKGVPFSQWLDEQWARRKPN